MPCKYATICRLDWIYAIVWIQPQDHQYPCAFQCIFCYMRQKIATIINFN